MSDSNANARLEALCDGVFAIAMTLLVIEVRAPEPESIHSAPDLWAALRSDGPTIGAFLLSFTVIFITWVNHHAVIRCIPRTSATFLFANGFLLLTVAFLPFPTALLGKFALSEHAAPAVVVYDATLATQAVGWILITRSALRGGLARDVDAQAWLRMNERSGVGAMVLYSLLAVIAVWLPTPVAMLTTASWIVWLLMSLRAKHT
jgi:TMEM175 potassium channel family protein